ncbi:CCL3 protein, partial [Nyctibius grandis]|nr:CCL3 protein [Nyctibius grandis]
MKVPAAALATLLLVAICSLAKAHLDDSSVTASSQMPDNVPILCCFRNMHVPIPRRLITSAYLTSSRCSLPAVILVTRKGTKVCADPQAPWVQRHLKHFQMLQH